MRRVLGWIVFGVGVALGLASLVMPSVHTSFLEDTFLLSQSWFPFVVGAAGVVLAATGWAWAHGESLSS